MPASRQVLTQQATVQADGTCTFTFDPPPMGYASTGSLCVYNSDSTTKWTISVAGTPVAVTVGPSTVSNVQAFTNETITITASGLSPGIIYNATFTARVDIDSNVQIVTPFSVPATVDISGGNITADITTGTVNIGNDVGVQNAAGTILVQGGDQSVALDQVVTIPVTATYGTWQTTISNVPIKPTDRSVVCCFDNFTFPSGVISFLYASVTGHQSGFFYGESQAASGQAISYGNPATIAVPCYGSKDTSVDITITIVGEFTVAGNLECNLLVISVPDEAVAGYSPFAPSYTSLTDGVGNIYGTDSGKELITQPRATSRQLVQFATATATNQTGVSIYQILAGNYIELLYMHMRVYDTTTNAGDFLAILIGGVYVYLKFYSTIPIDSEVALPPGFVVGSSSGPVDITFDNIGNVQGDATIAYRQCNS
jgi:hypothetical protein